MFSHLLCLFVKLVCCGRYVHTYLHTGTWVHLWRSEDNFWKSVPTFQFIEARSLCLYCYGLCYRPAGHKLWVILLFPTLILRWNPRDCRYALPHHIGFEGWAWVHGIAWLARVSTGSPCCSFHYQLVEGRISSQYHGFLVFPYLPTYFELLGGKNECLLFTWSSSVYKC